MMKPIPKKWYATFAPEITYPIFVEDNDRGARHYNVKYSQEENFRLLQFLYTSQSR